MVRLEQQNRPFKRRGLARLAALLAAAMLAVLAFAVPTPVVAGDTQAPSSFSIESGGVKSLQLGLGRSVIVDFRWRRGLVLTMTRPVLEEPPPIPPPPVLE